MEKLQHGFIQGELVQIKSKKEIKECLDRFSKHDGCLFMEQMWQYCDQKHRIAKVVKHVFDEKGVRMYKTKVPLYIMHNLICDGKIEEAEYHCDHSCYLMWHQNWIKKT